MRKKIWALGLTMCMAASLAACGGNSSSETTATTTAAEASAEDGAESTDAASEAEETETETAELKTVAEGKLTVATSPDFAPYEFYAIGEDGTPALAGFDMALAQYIADDLGLELEVVTVDFDGVLSEPSGKALWIFPICIISADSHW